MNKKTTKFNFSVDPVLHRKIKTAAAANGTSMQAFLVDAAKEKLAAVEKEAIA